MGHRMGISPALWDASLPLEFATALGLAGEVVETVVYGCRLLTPPGASKGLARGYSVYSGSSIFFTD
jgi:hypothetical protein